MSTASTHDLRVEYARAGSRAAVASTGLLLTLAAHAAGGHRVHLLAVAPLLWANLVGAIVLMGHAFDRIRGAYGRDGFAAHSVVRLFVLLMSAQIGLHVAIGEVPWAFGVMHHESVSAPIPLAAVVTHTFAGVLLAVLIAWGERILAGLLGVVRSLADLLRARPAGCPGPCRASEWCSGWTSAALDDAVPPRGPPLPVV